VSGQAAAYHERLETTLFPRGLFLGGSFQTGSLGQTRGEVSALKQALKNKKVEVGDTYTLEEIAQAETALGKRLEWRVAQDSSDVCAVTTTKKGAVKAKFTESGKCSIIWSDPKKDEEGKYTFKVIA